MKKENRKAAQQRRAMERKKEKQIKALKKFLSYFIPITAVLVLAIVIIVDTVKNSASSNVSDSQEETQTASQQDTEASEEEETTLSTDTSLTVEDGDTVNIDYTGSVDGVEFEGGSTGGSGTDLVIGSGSYIDDFEEQLIGAHPQDSVDVNVTFPENYGNEELNGKDALFKVTINGIYK